MADITDLDGRRISRLRLRDDGGAALMSASLQGDLKGYLSKEAKSLGGAVRKGIRKTMRGMKREMDRQMRAAGIKMFKRGRSEWWIGILYNSRSDAGLNTVGKVYSGFRSAASLFDTGGRIRPKQGKYLFIQNPNGPPINVKGLRTLRERTALIPTKNPNTKLVILKKSGNGEPVVLGWMVTNVHVRKKIDFDSSANKWGESMPQAIVDELD
jgi:hypothetical protein